MIKEYASPDFFLLITGIILTVHGFTFFAVFDIIEHGWIFFFAILIMLLAGGTMFWGELERIIDNVYK